MVLELHCLGGRWLSLSPGLYEGLRDLHDLGPGTWHAPLAPSIEEMLRRQAVPEELQKLLESKRKEVDYVGENQEGIIYPELSGQRHSR